MAENNTNSLPGPVKWAVRVAKILFIAFSAPVRAMYDVIQNSVVTSATTVCVFALVICGGFEAFYGHTYRTALEAEANYDTEKARKLAFENRTNEPEAALGNFTSYVANYFNNDGNEGVLVSFYPVSGATSYNIIWKINESVRGIVRLDNPIAAEDGFIHKQIMREDFQVNGTSVWVNNGVIEFYIIANNDVNSTKTATMFRTRIRS